MKRLAKSVSATLCASILCSLVLCYNAFTAFAEDTTTAETTASTEASTAVSEDVKVVSIKADADNDYIERDTETSCYKTKKDGYYSVVQKYDGRYYNDHFDSPDYYSDGFDDYMSAFSFTEFKAGDVMETSTWFGDDIEEYIAYSADGNTISAILKIETLKESSVEVKSSINASYSIVSETSNECVINVVASLTKGTYFLAGDVYKYNSTDDNYLLVGSLADNILGSESISTDFSIYENGKYKIYLTAEDGSWYSIVLTVDNIDSSVISDDKFSDKKAPTLTIEQENKSGLVDGDVFGITVKSDEKCSIYIGNELFTDVTEATKYVSTNGVYEVLAVDSWGNSTSEKVTVTAFGDGTFPEDANFNANENENILALSNTNKDSFWEDAANGKISGVSSSNGSTSLSTLPQTGGFKVACVVLSSGIAIAGGAFVLKKNGFKFKGRKGKGDK